MVELLGRPQGRLNKTSQAALKLRKVNKSFRIIKELADCAVLVEQRWRKILDFAKFVGINASPRVMSSMEHQLWWRILYDEHFYR